MDGMRVIKRKVLLEFGETHPPARGPLEYWFRLVKAGGRQTTADVKRVFGSSIDFIANNSVVFDIKGNDYRLIAEINYRRHAVFIRFLVTLVDAYEEKRSTIGMPDPIEAIEIQMENLGLSRKDLMDHLGKSSGRISDILNRRRALTLTDIRMVSTALHVPIAVLTQEYPLHEPTPKEAPDSIGEALPG